MTFKKPNFFCLVSEVFFSLLFLSNSSTPLLISGMLELFIGHIQIILFSSKYLTASEHPPSLFPSKIT
jgi:hypothetical protein